MAGFETKLFTFKTSKSELIQSTMNRKVIRPNLLLAGFQKCGSSSLFHMLNQHPEITGSKPKESFALTDPDYQHFSEKLAWKTSDFNWEPIFSERTRGYEYSYYMEGSVCNFYQEKALNYARTYPDTKVIFIIRDPIQRFISTYSYYGGSGVNLKPGTTLQQYYEMCLHKSHQHEAMNNALEHGCFCKFIEQWNEVLEQKNILVIGMRQVIKETKNAQSRIFSFLNIDSVVDLKLPHKNQSKVNRFPWINRLLVRYLSGLDLSSSSIGKFYKNLTETKPEPIKISESLEKDLRLYYKNEFKNYGQFF